MTTAATDSRHCSHASTHWCAAARCTAVTRVQPQSADRVQLQLRQARFDVLIAQLQRIETQTDSRLDRLTLRREADAGIVSGTAEFSATATHNP